ncbi:MAG: hypothetical protein KKF77_08210 [Proteobacteria bacterium]|nr:hypothetical protein [Pseudomonadota bacterium]
MKRFALGLALVLAFTAFAFAAAKTDDTAADNKAAGVQKAPAKGHVVVVRDVSAEDAKTGDITIKGKAGTVTHVTYGKSEKPETGAGGGKAVGQ